MVNCTQWESTETATKLRALSNILVEYCESVCGCNFSISRLNFYCFGNSPHYVTFRASVNLYSDLTSSQVIAIMESWVVSHSSVSILGEILHVDKECPVAISDINDPECPFLPISMVSQDLFEIIGSVSGVIIVFSLSLFVFWASAYKKCHRYD